MRRIRFCDECNLFTLKGKCSKDHKTRLFNPPKFSPSDKYGLYRRKVKKAELEKKSLL